MRSEDAELFPGVSENLVLLNLENVEPNGFRQRSALTDCDDITGCWFEARRAVAGDVPVPLFKTIVLFDVVEVVNPHDNGPLHFGGYDHTLDDPSTD